VVMQCLTFGTAKDRKAVIKSIKGLVFSKKKQGFSVVCFFVLCS